MPAVVACVLPPLALHIQPARKQKAEKDASLPRDGVHATPRESNITSIESTLTMEEVQLLPAQVLANA